jgi:D-psicose/D-tagatose/L-ribulose 3-epimerase
MKIGFNLLLWTTHVSSKHDRVLRSLKATGYDGVEVPIFEGTPAYYRKLGRKLDAMGLERTVVGIIPDLAINPIGSSPTQRKAAVKHFDWLLACAAELGAKNVCGPLHSTLGHFSGQGATSIERKRGIEVHRKAGELAQQRGLRITLESLNRFECYFLNTMADLDSYIREVDHPAIKGMYDSFHANIEEADPIAAVSRYRKAIQHVHISENDRGTPGRGHVDFTAIFRELKRIKYDGWLTIEAFGRSLPALAAATRVWRDFFPSPEQVYKEGYTLIKKGWSA